jgi:acetylornithine deacetylase
MAARRADPPARGGLTGSGHGDSVEQVLALLIRTPSVNPLLAPGEGDGEVAVAAVIRDWLTARGVEAWLEEAAPGRPNVMARIGTGGPVLLLCGHIDTVSAAGMSEPFEPVVRDGRMHGRGSYDMKSGVAAMMMVLARLARRPAAGTVLAAFVVDEEFASAGAFAVAARHRGDACILTEPSDERLVLAHKGFVWLELETTGVPAHGSRWDVGRSAVADMGRIIVALDEFDRTVLRTRSHPLTGPASLHCAMVSGGDGWSTFAPRCTLRVERRTIPGESAADAVAELTALVSGIVADAIVRTVLERAPLECPPEEAVARCLAAAITAAGGNAEPTGVAYWMDAAVFAAAGIPAVNYGVTGAGAHAADEWVELGSVERVAAVIEAAARAYATH